MLLLCSQNGSNMRLLCFSFTEIMRFYAFSQENKASWPKIEKVVKYCSFEYPKSHLVLFRAEETGKEAKKLNTKLLFER